MVILLYFFPVIYAAYTKNLPFITSGVDFLRKKYNNYNITNWRLKNMKRKVCLLFTFVVMICLVACISINVSAADVVTEGQCGENAYWSFDESTGTLTISGTGKIDDAVFYDEETGEMLIDENTGDPVWNMPWYHLKNQIYTIVIEEGITEIGACDFYSLYYLTEVDFPSTLEVVGCAAFCDCIRLEELDFPDSVKTLYVSNYNEIAIKKIDLPASLETTPTIPSIDEIFDFNMCAYLESLTIPEEIGTIEVTVDGSNPSIRNIYNYSTEALIKFDERNDMWYGDEATAEYMTVSIGAALASIEYGMTEEELEAFVLEKIIEYYGEDYAEKIPEPVLIETVPDYIKVYCYENSAQHLYCVENNINFVLIDENTHLDSDNDGICDICDRAHMCGEKVYYEFDENAGILTLKGEGETYSYEWLEAPFSYMNDINRVVVEEGITTLGNTIFQECSFESISLPHSLERIGDGAFDNCDLKELYIYENLAYIGQYVFRECYDLEKIIVDNNNPYYFSDDAGALYNKDVTELIHYPTNSSAVEYSIPETVISFSSYAFAYCENLKILNIHSAVTYIESNFYACNSIEKFVVAEDSSVYSSDEHGVLFDKDKTLLIKYPEGNKATKYMVPDSVITIGEFSIHMCDYLEELYIGDNVSYIEIGALSRNPALRKIEVAANNLNYCTDEDGVLFNKDKSILYQYTTGHPSKIYTIPNTVTKLSACSFEDSVNLNTSIVIPSSVTHIEDWVFPGKSFDFIYYTGTEEQWNSIQIDGNNDNLYVATIHFNYDGTEPIITKSGTCGEDVVFKLYSDGTLIISGTGEMWDYGEDHTDITTYFPPYITCEFDENDEPLGDFTIKKAVIEDGVTRIGNYAFQGCRALEEVEIADTVTSIGEAAFDFCTSLKHIKIPGSVKVLEQEAFSESALETIEIEEGLERIETLALFYCLNLKEVSLPESVEYIGDFAFIICDKLETLVINNKACEIGLEILMTVELDEDGNIVEDGNGKPIPTECPTVLKGYSGSTAEEYANTWTEAGYQIKFEALDVHTHLDSDKDGNCDNCGEIFIVDEGNCGANGDNVTWTFYSDGKLIISGTGAMADNYSEFGKLYIKNVVIESGVTSIGSWAFARCDDLVSIEIPDTVTSIGDSAFSGCESLTAVTIPASVTTIGKAAFFNCKSLESVAIPAGITSISELSFCGCKNLTSISIKKSVTYVDKKAFDSCVSLESVDYDGTAQDWDKITIKSGNDPLINATKNFGAVCRHTEDGHKTETFEEIIDEPTFFDDGSYEEITKCKNCGEELSREIKTIPDISLMETIADEIEEFFKGPISAIANVLKRILKIFGKK